MFNKTPRKCDCGSGNPRFPNYDARGIFLCSSCEKCHQRKMSGYRKDVLENPNYDADEPIEPEEYFGQPKAGFYPDDDPKAAAQEKWQSLWDTDEIDLY